MCKIGYDGFSMMPGKSMFLYLTVENTFMRCSLYRVFLKESIVFSRRLRHLCSIVSIYKIFSGKVQTLFSFPSFVDTP